MASGLRLAFTADLHWGTHRNGDAATLELCAHLQANPPDVLVLAGDIGAGDHFAPCLELFAGLICKKALIPGNHDIWVQENDPRGDSLHVYRVHLPEVSARHGFHYLDQEPLILADHHLALVGSINWYDYSWSLDELRRQVPDWEDRLRTKRFSRGRHNDARFVRWDLDDVRFTREVTAVLVQHLKQVLALVDGAIVVTHHACFYGVNYPRSEPATLDGLLWDAFSGNSAVEAVLAEHAARIPFAFCGHTHRPRDDCFHGIRGYNIGGDYHYKRLLVLDWPAGGVDSYVFGDPTTR